MNCPTCARPMRPLLFSSSCDFCANAHRIEVLMDHPRGPRVLCPVGDPGEVEDALPEGWTVGWSWCMSQPEDQQADGRWLLSISRLDEPPGELVVEYD